MIGDVYRSATVLYSATVLPSKPWENYAFKLFTMGEIFILFSLFSDICYFLQRYMKNKIGILENNMETYFP